MLTFPLPIHAVLYELEARIDGRVLRAVTEAKGEARDTYEDAVEAGHTTILHEEVLRGIHQISLGQLHPGADIAVTARFAIALSAIDGIISLRVPTTVGDIYGRSNLFERDELVHSDAPQAATINATIDTGTLRVNGRPMVGVPEIISLNAPIDIVVEGWKPRELKGVAADGRHVSLKMTPAVAGESPLNMAVLVDCSGSMNEAWSNNASKTKFDVVRDALGGISRNIRTRDHVELWDFQDDAVRVGATPEEDWSEILAHMRTPGGGTEIGAAIMAAQAERKLQDVLLITDGKSHALPIQFLARSGTRFSVALIGDDSLEANVGHLAALTAGQVLVPVEQSHIASALKDLLGHLRHAPQRSSGPGVETLRGGMKVIARWKSSSSETMEQGNRAVAAYAASLMLTSLSDDEAARLAVTEGLVTHLTSLVLVDRDGVQRKAPPQMVKLPLYSPVQSSRSAMMNYRARASTTFSAGPSTPKVSRYHDLAAVMDWHELDEREPFAVSEDDVADHRDARLPAAAEKLDIEPHILQLWILAEISKQDETAAEEVQHRVLEGLKPAVRTEIAEAGLEILEAAKLRTARQREKDNFRPQLIAKPNSAVLLARRIPWEEQFELLIEGDISGLGDDVAEAVQRLADHPDMLATANGVGRSPVATVLGLLARIVKCEDLYAGKAETELWKKMPMESWLYLTNEGTMLLCKLAP
ncbi:MAG: hypothetical protein C0511_14370 [Hyphomicrobium sp.]|nr:hypothetical protein [Hyphomicrobium sp.]